MLKSRATLTAAFLMRIMSASASPWVFLSLPAVLAAAAVPAIYSYVAGSVLPSKVPALRNKRICLLIAHPDDEAMFFAPTLLGLARPETGNHVKILCLSTGDAEGLGETRKKELVKSALMLGLQDEDDVFVIDNPDFRDSMTATWDKSKISNLLLRGFAPFHNRASPPPPNIDVLITFDRHGVSSHPNHISLYHGAREFIQKLAESTAIAHGIDLSDPKVDVSSLPPPPVDLYTLTSVGVARKYMGIADIFATLAGAPKAPEEPLPAPTQNGKKDEGSAIVDDEDEEEIQRGKMIASRPDGLVFANMLTGDRGVSTARAAMIQAHKSQMVWFRYGWIWFSRYMVLNELRRENITALLGAK